MPTINQLVRQGRKSISTKSDSPALNFGYNSKKKSLTNNPAPQKTWGGNSCRYHDTEEAKLRIAEICPCSSV